MSKLKNVWVITDKPSAYAELCAGARTLGESVTLCYAGERDKAAGAPMGVRCFITAAVPSVSSA